jgi:DNA-binding SARP family transcriptional activator
MDFLKIVLPALIALLGTILTAVIAYHRWKKEQAISKVGSYEADVQKAYAELWNRLEDIHIKLRTEGADSQIFRALLTGINAYLLKYSLWINKEDMALAQQYVKVLQKLDELVRTQGDDDEREAWATTAALPYKTIMRARAINEAMDEANSLRRKLIEKFQSALKGELRLDETH